MVESWTQEQLRQIPRWWDRAHMKDRTALELQGKQDVSLLLAAYEVEHARVELLEAENERLSESVILLDRLNRENAEYVERARSAVLSFASGFQALLNQERR